MSSGSLSGVRADFPLSYAKAEVLAAKFRRQMGYDLTCRIKGRELFENLCSWEVPVGAQMIPVETGVDSLDPPTEGLTRYDPESDRIEILLSQRTYENLLCEQPHSRYCLTHEVGHCALHKNQLKRLAKLPLHSRVAFHRGKKTHEAFFDTEWQANAFASALLMPAKGIARLEAKYKDALLSSEIATTYGVSFEAANYRLQAYQSRRPELLNLED